MTDTTFVLEGDALEAARSVAMQQLLTALGNITSSVFQPATLTRLLNAYRLVTRLGFEPSDPLAGCGVPQEQEDSGRRRRLSERQARELYRMAMDAADDAERPEERHHGDLVLRDQAMLVLHALGDQHPRGHIDLVSLPAAPTEIELAVREDS